MTRFILASVLSVLLGVQTLQAQQESDPGGPFWVLIEAQPGLTEITNSLRRYDNRLEDVNGFDHGSGWYGVALGPYSRADAERVLVTYRNQGRIPRDSYISNGSDFRRQIWPVGAEQRDRELASAPATAAEIDIMADDTAGERSAEVDAGEADPGPVAAEAREPQVVREAELPEETLAEARASERRLNREERMQIQIALKWAGYYAGRIDAAIGPGTRAAMAGWQRDNAFDRTGVLTSRQRADLLRQYNAVLDGLDLALVRDERTGIEMQMPTAEVAFARYEPPFAHFDARTDLGARVLLISQEGNRDTLYGLFDIMQTLEIVPQDGPRSREGDSFTLVGRNDRLVSHTEATLRNGRIKGFTLIWPAGDEERRTRLLSEMQASFTRLRGVLDPAQGWGDDHSFDLVSGLEIRKPRLSRSGFYVDRRGTVVTTTEVVANCGRITINHDYAAEIAARNAELGIAVLRPREALAPMSFADFQQSVPRLKSGVAVAGYSYGGVLNAPTLTFGKLADLRGLNGEEDLKRLALAALEGDAGGPVMDTGGAVLGMLLPETGGERKLPEDVSFAADSRAVLKVLREAGVSPSATSEIDDVAPADLSDRANRMTVLVSCWD